MCVLIGGRYSMLLMDSLKYNNQEFSKDLLRFIIAKKLHIKLYNTSLGVISPYDEPGNLLSLCLKKRDKLLIKEVLNVMMSNLADAREVCDIIKKYKEQLCSRFVDLYIELIANISLVNEEIDIDISPCNLPFLVNCSDSIETPNWILHVVRLENNTIINKFVNSENFQKIEHKIKSWDDLYFNIMSIHQKIQNLTDEDILKLKMTINDLKYKYTSSNKSYSSVIPCKGAAKIGETGLLHDMIRNEMEWESLGAENLQAIIECKWEHFGRKFLIIDLCFHLLLLVCFTGYCIMKVYRNNECPLYYRIIEYVLYVFPWLISFVNLIHEGIQICWTIFYDHKKTKELSWPRKIKSALYDWSYSKWNIMEFYVYISILVVIPMLGLDCTQNAMYSKVRISIISVTECLIWWKLLYFMFPFESTGPLVIMIFEVLNDIKVFLLVVTVILIGFSTTFFILFSEADNKDYNTYEISIATTYSMTLGFFDVLNFRNSELPFVTAIAFALYMFIMIIVLLNLLIAIMGDSFDRIKQREELSFYVAKCLTISDVEDKFAKFVRNAKK